MPRRNYSPKSRRVQRGKVVSRKVERVLASFFATGLTRPPRAYRAQAVKGGRS